MNKWNELTNSYESSHPSESSKKSNMATTKAMLAPKMLSLAKSAILNRDIVSVFVLTIMWVYNSY